jgi:hypothetical protein
LSEFGLPQRQLAAAGANAYGSIQWNNVLIAKIGLFLSKTAIQWHLDATDFLFKGK